MRFTVPDNWAQRCQNSRLLLMRTFATTARRTLVTTLLVTLRSTLEATLRSVSVLRGLLVVVLHFVTILLLSVGTFQLYSFFHLSVDRPSHPLGPLLRPALSILPNVDSQCSLRFFRFGDKSTYASLVHDLIAFTSSYEDSGRANHQVDCLQETSPRLVGNRQKCRFSLDRLGGGCNIQNRFGYEIGKPCILIKVNKVYKWQPQTLPQYGHEIAVLCDGLTSTDRELMGPLCFFDYRSTTSGGFSGGCHRGSGRIHTAFYPYKKQMGYEQPFVWLRFEKITRGVTVRIHCWMKVANVVSNTTRVSFEILMD